MQDRSVIRMICTPDATIPAYPAIECWSGPFDIDSTETEHVKYITARRTGTTLANNGETVGGEKLSSTGTRIPSVREKNAVEHRSIRNFPPYVEQQVKTMAKAKKISRRCSLELTVPGINFFSWVFFAGASFHDASLSDITRHVKQSHSRLLYRDIAFICYREIAFILLSAALKDRTTPSSMHMMRRIPALFTARFR